MTMARRHGSARARIFAALLALATAGFIALGIWQVERRTWKLDLIAQTDARVAAPPTAAPRPADWPRFDPAAALYRHVTVQGRFLHGSETLVQATTALGAGYWVISPLRTDAGWIVLINRGFVPADHRAPASRAAGQKTGEVRVTGLLRITEPGGSRLRTNDPAHGRWYSRDVAAIAHARTIGVVAPYFIDADATPNPGGLPVGGLTVIAFPNNHLVYALTWLGLAALSLAGAIRVLRDDER